MLWKLPVVILLGCLLGLSLLVIGALSIQAIQYKRHLNSCICEIAGNREGPRVSMSVDFTERNTEDSESVQALMGLHNANYREPDEEIELRDIS